MSAREIATPFELVLLSCKAYSLDDAIRDLAPAVGHETAVLPLLNGMRHLDLLAARLGPEHVLGGQCAIAATLDGDGDIVHLDKNHALSFGECRGGTSDRVRAIAEEMVDARFEGRASPQVLLEMWEKWVFLSALAGGTCLMRGAVGDIAAAPGGAQTMRDLLTESGAVAAADGFAPRPDFLERAQAILTAAGSPFTASMLRDIENGNPIEADHILGDLIARGEQSGALPTQRSLLRLAFTHLKVYETRIARSAAGR